MITSLFSTASMPSSNDHTKLRQKRFLGSKAVEMSQQSMRINNVVLCVDNADDVTPGISNFACDEPWEESNIYETCKVSCVITRNMTQI